MKSQTCHFILTIYKLFISSIAILYGPSVKILAKFFLYTVVITLLLFLACEDYSNECTEGFFFKLPAHLFYIMLILKKKF